MLHLWEEMRQLDWSRIYGPTDKPSKNLSQTSQSDTMQITNLS